MTPGMHECKRAVKFGPKLSRELRAEWTLVTGGFKPRTLTLGTLEKIRAELRRLDRPDAPPQVREFCRRMYERYPDLLLND